MKKPKREPALFKRYPRPWNIASGHMCYAVRDNSECLIAVVKDRTLARAIAKIGAKK